MINIPRNTADRIWKRAATIETRRAEEISPQVLIDIGRESGLSEDAVLTAYHQITSMDRFIAEEEQRAKTTIWTTVADLALTFAHTAARPLAHLLAAWFIGWFVGMALPDDEAAQSIAGIIRAIGLALVPVTFLRQVFSRPLPPLHHPSAPSGST